MAMGWNRGELNTWIWGTICAGALGISGVSSAIAAEEPSQVPEESEIAEPVKPSTQDIIGLIGGGAIDKNERCSLLVTPRHDINDYAGNYKLIDTRSRKVLAELSVLPGQRVEGAPATPIEEPIFYPRSPIPGDPAHLGQLILEGIAKDSKSGQFFLKQLTLVIDTTQQVIVGAVEQEIYNYQSAQAARTRRAIICGEVGQLRSVVAFHFDMSRAEKSGTGASASKPADTTDSEVIDSIDSEVIDALPAPSANNFIDYNNNGWVSDGYGSSYVGDHYRHNGIEFNWFNYWLWHNLLCGQSGTVRYVPAPPQVTRLSQRVIPSNVYQRERERMASDRRSEGMSTLRQAPGLSAAQAQSLNARTGATSNTYQDWKRSAVSQNALKVAKPGVDLMPGGSTGRTAGATGGGTDYSKQINVPSPRGNVVPNPRSAPSIWTSGTTSQAAAAKPSGSTSFSGPSSYGSTTTTVRPSTPSTSIFSGSSSGNSNTRSTGGYGGGSSSSTRSGSSSSGSGRR